MAEAVPATQPAPAATRGGRTIGRLWREATAEPRSNAAYLVELDGGWIPVSWADAAARVDDLANGLLALGIGKGDVVAVVGRSTLEWALVDFALALVGAVSAAIYPTSSSAECRYLLELEGAVAAVVEDDAAAELVRGGGDLPQLRRILTFADLPEVERAGREHGERHPDALARAEAAVDEEDTFTYIHTSGTTGPPKACVIRHRNYYEMAATVDRVDDFCTPQDVMLLWLPMAHNFGRLMHLCGPHAGFTIAFCPNPYAVAEALPAVRPTILPSAPRLYEKVHAAVTAQFEAATGVRRRLIDWALSVGASVSRLQQAGERIPAGRALQHRLADRLVFSKVRARMGGRLRFAISGAAPLRRDVAELFHALGILILEGYGLTECTTACSVNRVDRYRFGTVGPPLPGFEIRIADDGEILIRSQTVFAGYLADEAATREVLDDDGWVHSGDLGELEDGFLRITGRKKDILVTAGGKNVGPQPIEADLARSPLVAHAVVVGEGRPCLGALLTLDEEAARAWAAERGITGDADALAANEQLRAELQRSVDAANARRARFEQVKRFAVLPRDFSADADELTATMKLRRKAIERNFAAEIDALYR